MKIDPICDKLYDIVERNMNDGDMYFSKEAYVKFVGRAPRVLDILELDSIEDPDLFVERLYIQALDRLPDEVAKKGAKNIVSLDTSYKMRRVRDMSSSIEFGLRRSRLKNNIYYEHPQFDFTNARSNFIYKMKARVPEPIKKVIRKYVFHRE